MLLNYCPLPFWTSFTVPSFTLLSLASTFQQGSHEFQQGSEEVTHAFPKNPSKLNGIIFHGVHFIL